MDWANIKELSINGLWSNNPALVQLLGLCPLLAVTGTAINGLGLGLATLLVLVGSNVTVSLIREQVSKEIRIPVFVIVIATFVTVIELMMHAFLIELYLALGIFIPLIVTNCAIIGRAEAFASKNPVSASAFDGLMMGLGFTAVLVLLGGLRELIGTGRLLDGAERLFGEMAENWTITLFVPEHQLLLAILPPGAFILMGFIIAAKNAIDRLIAERHEQAPLVKAQRARVTGTDI